MSPTTTTVMDTFRQAAAKAGLALPERVELGRIVRFPGVGKSNGNTSGWAWLSDDGQGGAYGDWASGLSATWHAGHDHAMTTTERAAHKRRVAELRHIREKEERLQHADAAQRAQQLWDGAKPALADHPYLQKKQVGVHGLRVDGKNRLLIPLYDASGALCSIEFIDDASGKLFLLGGRVAGCFHLIGTLTDVLALTEGFATGASIHEATGYPVAVAFSAGNLLPVAQALRAKHPTVKIIIAGDNDIRDDETPNTGRDAATAAAKAVDGLVAIPEIDGKKCDFNDLHQQMGAEAVARAIAEATQPPASPSIDPADRVTYRQVSDIQAKPINWLWQGRFARGKVSMIAGNPGLGKSQITASMAAIVTTGGQWPVDRTTCELGNVVILSAEDDAADTLRPRLEAAGADLDRCFVLDAIVEGCLADGGELHRSFNLQTDLARLGAMLDEIGGAALIVIDPITAYLGGADSHKNAEIRALLSPLSDLAGQHGAAVVCISHLNKNAGGEALLRVTGSLAFVAAARAAFVVVKDPDNDTRRLFPPLKNNIGNDTSGVAFTVQSAQIESPAGPIATSRVVWEGEAVTISADSAMSQPLDQEERGEADEAKEFLRGLLADGPVPSKQIRADAEGAGHAWRTVQRAQKALGIVALKKGMKEGWTWRLPRPSQPEECQETPKNSTQRDWRPSHSSGSVGGLRGDEPLQLEVEI